MSPLRLVVPDAITMQHAPAFIKIGLAMETALARASLYNFLAAAFGDPPAPALVRTWEQVLPELPPASQGELLQAYTRLLIGPGAGYAPPFASVYLNPSLPGKPQLWGPAAVAAEAFYRETGVEIAPGQPRLPDHLALELQFMQHLCAREADAEAHGDIAGAEEWRSRQAVFLHDHLWPWLPGFAGRVAQAGAHPVYHALVVFLLDFVRSEMNSVESPTSRLR